MLSGSGEYGADVKKFLPAFIGRRLTMAGLGAVFSVAVLAGCATMSNGSTGDMSRSMSDVASATMTASLAFTQHQNDRSTDAVTGTTLDDMLDELLTAQTAVAELDTATDAERKLLTETLERIRACVDAINTARQSLADPTIDADTAQKLLDASADDAIELSDELEQYR